MTAPARGTLTSFVTRLSPDAAWHGVAATACRPRAPKQMAAVPHPGSLPGDPPPAAPGAAGEGWGMQQDGQPRLPPRPWGCGSPASCQRPSVGLDNAEPPGTPGRCLRAAPSLESDKEGTTAAVPRGERSPRPGNRTRSPETDPNTGGCSPGPRRGLVAGPALPGVLAGLVPSSVLPVS